MDLHLTVQGIAVIVAILGHAGATVWWASKVAARLDNLYVGLMRMDRELEKRDTQISAIWKRLDEVRDMIPDAKG